MMVLQVQTEDGDIPNAAIKQPCHAGGTSRGQQTCVHPRIRPAHVHTWGGMGERDLAYHWVTHAVQDKASQPASQQASSAVRITNGDDMPRRGAASLFLWHVNPRPSLL